MAAHIDIAIGLEGDAFGGEEGTLALPAGGGATSMVDDTVARQTAGLGSIAESATDLARVGGPPCPSGYGAVGGNVAARYLGDDGKDIGTELTGLEGCHLGVDVHEGKARN